MLPVRRPAARLAPAAASAASAACVAARRRPPPPLAPPHLRRLASHAAPPPLAPPHLRRVASHAAPPPRPPHLATLSDADVRTFRSLLGDGGVSTDADDLARVSVDWMRQYRGAASVLLRPTTTEQVSAVLAHCHARRLAVVPQGGNTGLVGGGVPLWDEVVLSLERMNAVLSFDAATGVVVA